MAELAVEIVGAWHGAVNAGDVEGVVAVCAEDVEVGGPRGVGRGVEVLRGWFARAGIRLEMGRVYARGSTVVVEQRASWGGQEQVVASLFEVRAGKVARIVRYDEGLDAALAAGGLSRADETSAA